MVTFGRVLLILLSTVTVVSSSAQGSEFLVAFLSNGQGTTDPQLIVSNLDQKDTTAMVTVSSAVNATILVTRDVRSVDTLNVPYTYRMNTNGRNDKAILVKSTNIHVSLSAKNSEESSTDRFLVIPTRKLGKRHVVLTHHDDKYVSEFALVATKNDTLVNITYPTGETTSLLLQQYESYREQSENSDLTSTKIISSHPVAMFAGGMTTNTRKMLVGHIAEQLLSVEYWGRTFLISPVSMTGDFLKIIGYSEGTAVRIWRNSTGIYEFKTVTPSQPLVIEMGAKGDDHFLVEANDTVLVGQFSQTNKQNKDMIVGFTLVQSTEQFLNTYVIMKSQMSFGFEEYVRIVAQKNQEWMSPSPMTSTFQPVFTSHKTVIEQLGPVQQEFRGYPAFGMNLYDISFSDASSQLVDLSLQFQPENCIQTPVVQSDHFDNDCDGKVDEEIADSLDNDGDNATDEDTNNILVNATQGNISTTHSMNVTLTSQNPFNSSTTSAHTTGSATKATYEESTNTLAGTDGSIRGTSNNTSGNPQANESGSETTTASDNPGQEEPTTDNPTKEDTDQNSWAEKNSTVTDNPAHRHDTLATENATKHMTTADHAAQRDTSVTDIVPQEDVTTADHAAQRDTSVTDNAPQQDMTTVDRATQRDTSAIGNAAQNDITTSDQVAEYDKQTDHNGPQDTTSAGGMGEERTTRVEKLKEVQPTTPGIKEEMTTAQDTAHNPRETKSPSEPTLPSSGTNVDKSAVQSAEPEVQKESTDDIGILTIVAPSFICGVPFLIVVLCCFRSIVAGVCRKKVYPKEKKSYVQPVYKS